MIQVLDVRRSQESVVTMAMAVIPCPGNTIRPIRSDAPDCNAETPCDGISSEVNAEHTCGE